MQTYWGVDAASALDGRTNILARVANAYARPDFVGRYLCTIGGLSTGLAAAEVAYLHAAGVAILPIYNMTNVNVVAGSVQDGTDVGLRAAGLARALGIPSGVALAIDIETGWRPSTDFLSGAIRGLNTQGYQAMFYINTRDRNHVQACIVQRMLAKDLSCLYWTCQDEDPAWVQGGPMRSFVPFTSSMPALARDVVAHQYAIDQLGGSVDLDTMNERGFAHLWHPASVVMKGALMRPPLDGPLLITQLFGGNPQREAYTAAGGHRVLGHTGIDINAALGQAVYPAWDGVARVIDAGQVGFGLHVIVTAADGRAALYGHLSGVEVANGAQVHVHTPFAKAGSSGNSTGPHVHFEIQEQHPDLDNGYLGCRDPLGGFDHDVLDHIDLSLTNL